MNSLLNRCTTPKIAEPRWWYTAVPKQGNLCSRSRLSSHDSTCAFETILRQSRAGGRA